MIRAYNKKGRSPSGGDLPLPDNAGNISAHPPKRLPCENDGDVREIIQNSLHYQ